MCIQPEWSTPVPSRLHGRSAEEGQSGGEGYSTQTLRTSQTSLHVFSFSLLSPPPGPGLSTVFHFGELFSNLIAESHYILKLGDCF